MSDDSDVSFQTIYPDLTRGYVLVQHLTDDHHEVDDFKLFWLEQCAGPRCREFRSRWVNVDHISSHGMRNRDFFLPSDSQASERFSVRNNRELAYIFSSQESKKQSSIWHS